ncbi:MAG TPA: hypothetical protein H9874_11785, partial [Candidatus Bilophila faecipullorum]|nr:hypothetical protein [Candidatus Bilophila faecipullorum]
MRLKAAGHRGVVGYGWSAFIAALEAEARARDARLKDMALAARMALYADARQFRAFLEDGE